MLTPGCALHRLSAPEVFFAYHPENSANTTPIAPGETAYGDPWASQSLLLQRCLLVPIQNKGLHLPCPCRRYFKNAHTGKFCRLQPFPLGLLSLSLASCATKGVICDLLTAADATIFTYTGSGLKYKGVPLVQTPGSATLVLSSDPACRAPDGDRLTFPIVTLSREPPTCLPPTVYLGGELAPECVASQQGPRQCGVACMLQSCTLQRDAFLPQCD
jgi:hypothetical protein